jgi:uncharacterized protein
MEDDAPERVVLDTNILVSGFLFPASAPGQALDFVLEKYRLLMSMEVAAELMGVMRREKFNRYLSPQLREEVVADAIRDSTFVTTTTVITECRDPDDNKFLELAIDGQAMAIVTGDADLLDLNPFRGLPVLSPHQFLTQFANR